MARIRRALEDERSPRAANSNDGSYLNDRSCDARHQLRSLVLPSDRTASLMMPAAARAVYVRANGNHSSRHKLAQLLLAASIILSFASFSNAQNVGIGTATPDASSILELHTTSLGLLPPRLTDAQMQAVSSPATGDFAYSTTYKNYYYFNGTIWTPLIGSGWSLTGDLGTSPSTNFLGTKNGVDLVQKTNSNERMRFYNGGSVGLTNTLNSAESLIFYEASGLGSLYTAFKAGVQSSTAHYIWPLSGDGIPGQALVTDSLLGDLSWHTFATFGGSGSQSLWKRGSAAGGEYADSSGGTDSGPYSITAGFHSSVTGNYEMVFGDSTSGVSGSYGAVNGGSGNESSGNYDLVAGGQDNNASATASNIGGGSSNTTSGNEEVVIGGSKNSFSGSNSTIIGGYANKTNSNNEMLYGFNASNGTNGSAVFKIGTHTLMGVGTASPTQAMDVVGNVKFSKVLKPNALAGTSGQYLLSAGAGSPPTWGSATFLANNWKLLGTSGTLPATNYIGTTDANDLVIRTSDVEAVRVASNGTVGIGMTSPGHQLAVRSTSAVDETAAVYGNANASTNLQSVGVWGRVDNTGSSNIGTIAILATGDGRTSAGSTNAALQISQGEFAVGRTTESPSAGSTAESASGGTLYSQQGPSGVIQLSMQSDLYSTAPTAGVFQDLGSVTINNQYITSNSIIIAGVVAKNNGGASPDPKNSIYRVDVASRTTGSCVIRIGMIPFVTDANTYQGSDNIRIAYAVINPGK